MRYPQLSLTVSGQELACGTINNVDYEIVGDHSDSITGINVADFAATLLERSRRLWNDSPDKGDTYASILIEDFVVFPWDEFASYYLDLTKEGEFTITIYFISLIPSSPEKIKQIIEPIIRRFALHLIETSEASEGLASTFDNGARSWFMKCTGPTQNLTLGDLFALRRELSYRAFFFENSLKHPNLIIDILEAGGASELIGTPESDTLEVKSVDYMSKYQGDRWKIELAQDVSSFANAELGGLLLVGIKSREVEGRDTLDKITPLSPNPKRLSQYRDVINARIHPPIDDLRIGAIPVGHKEILYVLIPPQRDERKPFIVLGGILEGKIEGKTFSIVRRRGDRTVWVDPREFHAMLTAGRTFFRTGNRPNTQNNGY
ncbi:AlbA family DNA-binding domain-containing protein [Streptosporangium saharense]|uniref:AlbA family DNA-binding domain-containing protein n=1 Tax=Streptosporangium saharense TaxID=1706840 RepID=UPI0034233B04